MALRLRPRIRWSAVVGLVVLTVAGCGGGPAADEGSITVFAAASLTDLFTELGAEFEADNPGTTVTFNFAGSSSLREQILEGAPADVFASADAADAERLVEVDAVRGEPRFFAANRLVLAVPAGNPGDVSGPRDLADPDLLVGLCAEEVPCGRLGREALAAADVTASVDTNEPDARALLTRIEAGELDAGVVYASDVASSEGAVEAIDIPGAESLVVEYPVVVLDGASQGDLAEEFVAFVTSPGNLDLLESHGFERP